MELEFQTQQKQVSSTTNQRDRNRSTTKKTKFVGVRQRPSGKWVAEIKNTTQKIRMWLGTFDTAEEAARAYDEAACLLRGTNTRTNFVDNIPPNSALSLKIKNLLNQKKGLKHSATQKTAAQNSPAKVGSYSCNITSPSASSLKHDVQSFDDAYKPDLSNFNGGIEMGNLQFDHLSSEFDLMSTGGFDGIFSNQENGFEVPKSTGTTSENQIIPDYFEKMKVERQISASLYPMNGVNESWENVDDCSGDAFWDLPMLCQMFYLS